MRRVRAAVVAAFVLMFAAPAPTQAGGIAGLFVGVCTLELNVSYAAPVTTTPTATTAGVVGGGTCVVNDQVAPLHVTGWLAANPTTGFGCAGGVAHGVARFSLVGVSGFPNPDVQLAVVNQGALLSVVGVVLLTTFEGAGELLQAPATSAACTSGSVTSATWTGGFAFQDPSPPPVEG